MMRAIAIKKQLRQIEIIAQKLLRTIFNKYVGKHSEPIAKISERPQIHKLHIWSIFSLPMLLHFSLCKIKVGYEKESSRVAFLSFFQSLLWVDG